MTSKSPPIAAQVHDYNLSLFLSFLRQNRNKTCPELTKLRSDKKNSREHALEPSLQSWAPTEIFVGRGGASPKKSSTMK